MASPDDRADWAWRSPLVLALAALGLFLAIAEVARPCFFLHDDNATWFLGAYVHDFHVLTQTGRLAEVNFYQYGGEPFLQQGQTAVLYPPVYVAVALARWLGGDARWTIEWLAAGHLFAGLLGFYFWTRRGGAAPILAALGGLAWVLNPFVLLIGANWITVIYLACYLPWLFWALDRLLLQPSPRAAFFLGTILALFFLQGYVQWVAYAILFLIPYTLIRLVDRSVWPRVPALLYFLVVAALIFFIFATPLLVPMLHATENSAARAVPISVVEALVYRVTAADFFHAQFGFFHPQFIFGVSTVILFCPALFLLPLMLLRFFRVEPSLRQRLFPLLLLALLAVLFSSRWHVYVTLLPLFEKFRWPFKVFVFADFFLIASVVWSVTSWKRVSWAIACVSVLALANAVISISGHDENAFSRTTLPTSVNSLPARVDTNLGRVIAIDDLLPETSSARFFTHGFGTFFAVPSLGGYDPLVGPEQLRFALGLDFPNVFRAAVTPEIRQQLDPRAVRYWIVDPASPQLNEIESLPGLKRIATDPDRVIFEDIQAQPLVYFREGPARPGSVTYSGNSLRIPLRGFTSPAQISVGPTDGWWYRLDRGPWQKPAYVNNRLVIDFPATARRLEVSFFDRRLRAGLWISAGLSVLLGILLMGNNLLRKRITLNSF